MKILKSGTLFAGMFGVSCTALSLEAGHFHAGILMVAALAASAKWAVAEIHHKAWAKIEKQKGVI